MTAPEQSQHTWWRRDTFAAIVVRAIIVTIAVWGSSIAFSVVAFSDIVPIWFPPLATVVAVFITISEVLVLYSYGRKLMTLHVPVHDPAFITSMTVGAVSSITTFMGTAAALAVTVFVGTPQPLGSPSAGALLSFALPALWLFIMLTVRFSEACYFYQVWDLRRRRAPRT